MGRLLARIKKFLARHDNLEENVAEAAAAGVVLEAVNALLRRAGVRLAIFGAGAASAAVFTAVMSSSSVHLSPGPSLTRYVGHHAAAYRVDPAAALAVSTMEGAGGGIGDNGTSFGPWQMHAGGALPLSVYHGPYSAATQAWAWSGTGVDYALRHIAGVCRGLHGYPAVDCIVSRFERPLRPAPEIAGAWRAYPAIARSLHVKPPQPKYLKKGWPKPVPAWCWKWAQWRLGRGPYKGHARDPRYRPHSAPHRIHVWWWRWFNHHWRHT